MSQHDMTIAGGTGAAVRGDIEAAVQALASTSLGTSAPATKYQGQHHIDSNTPSASVWTESIWDGSEWCPYLYIDASSNKAWGIYSLPLTGSGGVSGAYAMSGDIMMGQNATATPGVGNTTLGAVLAANGSLHLSNNGSYVGAMNRNGNGTMLGFCISGTVVGSISVSGSATTYNTSSDYRLKFDVETIDGAAAEAIVRGLRAVRFRWLSDPLGLRQFGFLSHEYAEHIPQGVTGTKDATDGEGRIVPQGMDATTAVPVLTAALKRAFELIDALTARVGALEPAP